MRTIVELYLDKVNSGQLELDPVQQALAQRFDALNESLAQKQLSSKSSSLGWLFGRKDKTDGVKGLYVWGSVGRGKSMLMDLFFANANFEPKQRVHFNDFMADAQNQIQAQRDLYKKGLTKQEDPIPPVAKALAEKAQLLCFDEFTVTDIADATILGRLFTGMFEAGATIVATSNVPPDNLYKDGLNRQRFLPFIELLKSKTEEYKLDAPKDYRLEKLSHAPIYSAPLNERSSEIIESIWHKFIGEEKPKSASIKHKGRNIHVPMAITGVARFDFSDLCEKPLAGADYLAIAKQYHTIFIENVPILSGEMRNEAKRFILLIDTLYDRKIKLVMSAAANPHALYSGKSGTEAFEFERTSSRLIEMQSKEYLGE